MIIFLSIIGILTLALILLTVREIGFRVVSPFGWKKVIHDTGTYYFILTHHPDYKDEFFVRISKYPLILFINDDIKASIYKRNCMELDAVRSKFVELIKSYNDAQLKNKMIKDKFYQIKTWDGDVMTTQVKRDKKLEKILD